MTMFVALKFFIISLFAGCTIFSALSTQAHPQGEEGGGEGGEGGPFSQEQLQQMGMEIGQKVGEQMMQVGKEEFQTGLHKVEDKIDRNTDKWIDSMSSSVQGGR